MVMVHGKHFQVDEGLLDGHHAPSKLPKVADEIDTELEKIKNSDALSEQQKENFRDKLITHKKNIKTSGKPRKNYNDAIRDLENIEGKRKAAEAAAQQQAASDEEVELESDLKPPQMEIDVDNLDETDGASESPSADSGDSGEVSEALEDFDVEEMANKMMDDPQAAFDEINEMDFEDAQMAFNELQMYMQQIQRMTEMMSNLTSMQHKTESAVIKNIR